MKFIPKLQFIIDKDYDRQMIYQMLRPNEPAGVENRAATMGIDLATAKQISKMSKEEALGFLSKSVDLRYSSTEEKLKITQKLYQKSWDEINDVFFNFVAGKTGFEWKYNKYKCVVSLYHRGISNWNGNTISRIWSENPYVMRKITAHELIISHIFDIFHDSEDYKNKLDDNKIWKIAEISAWCITGLEPEIIKLWPWTPEAQLFPLKHNYSQLVPLQIELGEVYKYTSNFK